MGRIYYLISSIIGAELALLFIGFSKNKNFDMSYNKMAFISLAIIIATIVLCYIFQQLKYHIILLFSKGNTNKAIKYLENKLNKTGDKVLKSKLCIRLTDLYIKSDDFSNALKSIELANPSLSQKRFNLLFNLSPQYKLEYYIKSVYLNILMNNLMFASDEIKNGRKYFEKYKNNIKYKSEILKIYAMDEYSKGNYSKAEEYINKAIESRKELSPDYELFFILGKIFLKTQRYILFESAMNKVINLSQSQQLISAAKAYLINNIN